MKTYSFSLKSNPSNDFFCIKAANTVDLNIEEKLTHDMEIKADVESDFNIGLILGNSGSGKTTLAKYIWGNDCFKNDTDLEAPVISQMEGDFNTRQKILSGIGLSSVPCWIRPVKTLSNGQRFRADIAIMMSKAANFMIIDEWTSVVNRTIAKIMSHSVAKFARKLNKKIVLLSCHYDIIDWLNPDWIIDCNKQTYENHRIKKLPDRKKNSNLQLNPAQKTHGKVLASITI